MLAKGIYLCGLVFALLSPALQGCVQQADIPERAQTPAYTPNTCTLQRRPPPSNPVCMPLLHATRIRQTIQFDAYLTPFGSPLPDVVQSEFIVRNKSGDIVFKNNHAFGLDGQPCNLTMSGNSPDLGDNLGEGAYEAELIINGHSSNTISFHFGKNASIEFHDLSIECIQMRDTAASPLITDEYPFILMQYNHKEDTSISLSDALIRSNWIQDGRLAEHQGLVWIGGDTAAKDTGFSSFIRQKDFGMKLSPGRHYAVLSFAGHVSNLLQIDVEP